MPISLVGLRYLTQIVASAPAASRSGLRDVPAKPREATRTGRTALAEAVHRLEPDAHRVVRQRAQECQGE